MRGRQERILSVNGFTLLEVIIAGGLLSVMLLAVSSFFYMNSTVVFTFQVQAAKNTIVSRVRTTILTPSAIRASALQAGAATQPYLCLELTGVNPSTACQSGIETSLILYDGFTDPGRAYTDGDQVVSGLGTAGTLTAGTPAGTPKRYTVAGRPCASTATAAQCPLEVYTTIIPHCKPAFVGLPGPTDLTEPAAGSTCRYAESVEVRYVVWPVPGLVRSVDNLQAEVLLEPVRGRIYLNVCQLVGKC
jgi:Tfp pilus assembly protein PilV